MAASMSEQNKNEIELVRNFDLNLIDKEFITNPFPTCRALRNHSPLHQNADGSLFLTRYDDVMTAYRHPAMSSDKKVAFKEKFGEYNLKKSISAWVVAQKKTLKSFNLEESKKYCEKQVSKQKEDN